MSRKGTKHFRWTTEHLRFIMRNLNVLTNAELAKQIGCKPTTLAGFRKRNRLLKRDTGYFPKGNVPHNKGKKYAPAHVGVFAKSRFKKGNTPFNTRSIGDVWTRREGQYTYWMTKTENGIEYYHRWLWAKHHGPIPANHRVQFIDGDCSNASLDNLRCISKGQAMREANTKCDTKKRSTNIWKTRRLNEAKLNSKPYQVAP